MRPSLFVACVVLAIVVLTCVGLTIPCGEVDKLIAWTGTADSNTRLDNCIASRRAITVNGADADAAAFTVSGSELGQITFQGNFRTGFRLTIDTTTLTSPLTFQNFVAERPEITIDGVTVEMATFGAAPEFSLMSFSTSQITSLVPTSPASLVIKNSVFSAGCDIPSVCGNKRYGGIAIIDSEFHNVAFSMESTAASFLRGSMNRFFLADQANLTDVSMMFKDVIVALTADDKATNLVSDGTAVLFQSTTMSQVTASFEAFDVKGTVLTGGLRTVVFSSCNTSGLSFDVSRSNWTFSSADSTGTPGEVKAIQFTATGSVHTADTVRVTMRDSTVSLSGTGGSQLVAGTAFESEWLHMTNTHIELSNVALFATGAAVSGVKLQPGASTNVSISIAGASLVLEESCTASCDSLEPVAVVGLASPTAATTPPAQNISLELVNLNASVEAFNMNRAAAIVSLAHTSSDFVIVATGSRLNATAAVGTAAIVLIAAPTDGLSASLAQNHIFKITSKTSSPSYWGAVLLSSGVAGLSNVDFTLDRTSVECDGGQQAAIAAIVRGDIHGSGVKLALLQLHDVRVIASEVYLTYLSENTLDAAISTEMRGITATLVASQLVTVYHSLGHFNGGPGNGTVALTGVHVSVEGKLSNLFGCVTTKLESGSRIATTSLTNVSVTGFQCSGFTHMQLDVDHQRADCPAFAVEPATIPSAQAITLIYVAASGSGTGEGCFKLDMLPGRWVQPRGSGTDLSTALQLKIGDTSFGTSTITLNNAKFMGFSPLLTINYKGDPWDSKHELPASVAPSFNTSCAWQGRTRISRETVLSALPPSRITYFPVPLDEQASAYCPFSFTESLTSSVSPIPPPTSTKSKSESVSVTPPPTASPTFPPTVTPADTPTPSLSMTPPPTKTKISTGSESLTLSMTDTLAISESQTSTKKPHMACGDTGFRIWLPANLTEVMSTYGASGTPIAEANISVSGNSIDVPSGFTQNGASIVVELTGHVAFGIFSSMTEESLARSPAFQLKATCPSDVDDRSFTCEDIAGRIQAETQQRVLSPRYMLLTFPRISSDVDVPVTMSMAARGVLQCHTITEPTVFGATFKTSFELPTALAAVAETNGAISIAAGAVSPGMAVDAQGLAAFALISCGSSGGRYAMQKTNFLLSPYSIGPEPEGYLLFNIAAVCSLLGLQLIGIVIVKESSYSWSVNTWAEAFSFMRCPSVFFLAVLLTQQGNAILSLRLIFDQVKTRVSFVSVSWTILFPVWVLWLYKRKAYPGWGERDNPTEKIRFFAYDKEAGADWPQTRLVRFFKKLCVPIGRWGPLHMRRIYGSLIASLKPTWLMFTAAPLLQADIVAVMAAVRSKTRWQCIMQYSVLILMYFAFALLVFLARPYRTMIDNIFQILSSILLGLILAASCGLALDPLDWRAQGMMGVLLTLQLVLSIVRSIYAIWVRVLDRIFWATKSGKVLWNASRDDFDTRNEFQRLVDYQTSLEEGELEPGLAVPMLAVGATGGDSPKPEYSTSEDSALTEAADDDTPYSPLQENHYEPPAPPALPPVAAQDELPKKDLADDDINLDDIESVDSIAELQEEEEPHEPTSGGDATISAGAATPGVDECETPPVREEDPPRKLSRGSSEEDIQAE